MITKTRTNIFNQNLIQLCLPKGENRKEDNFMKNLPKWVEFLFHEWILPWFVFRFNYTRNRRHKKIRFRPACIFTCCLQGLLVFMACFRGLRKNVPWGFSNVSLQLYSFLMFSNNDCSNTRENAAKLLKRKTYWNNKILSVTC